MFLSLNTAHGVESKLCTTGRSVCVLNQSGDLRVGFKQAFPVIRTVVAQVGVVLDEYVAVTDLPQSAQAQVC